MKISKRLVLGGRELLGPGQRAFDAQRAHAHVGGAARGGAFFEGDDFQTQLSRRNGRCQTAGTGGNHDNVCLKSFHFLLLNMGP